MNRQELIEAILLEKDGVITTADALKHQISKPVFLEYVKQMGLRKMAHGIYASMTRGRIFSGRFRCSTHLLVFHMKVRCICTECQRGSLIQSVIRCAVIISKGHCVTC
jgi:hypothetical protein